MGIIRLDLSLLETKVQKVLPIDFITGKFIGNKTKRRIKDYIWILYSYCSSNGYPIPFIIIYQELGISKRQFKVQINKFNKEDRAFWCNQPNVPFKNV